VTDDTPPELQFTAQKHHTEVTFYARDPNGNRYSYTHLGNVERMSLIDLVAVEISKADTPARIAWWSEIQSKLSDDLDDL
jgi:hypothetical protein